MTKILVLFLMFLGIPAVAFATGDPLCVAVNKIDAIWPFIEIAVPAIIAIVLIIGGAMLARKDELGKGMAIIALGFFVGILLAAIFQAIPIDKLTC